MLEDYNANILPGSRIDQRAADGTDKQEWTLIIGPDDYCTLKNRHSGMALEDYGGTTNTGAPVVQASPYSSASQQWIFTAVPRQWGRQENRYRSLPRTSGMTAYAEVFTEITD